MTSLPAPAPIANPTNPRDAWPAWTDESRWTIAPDDDLAGEPMDGPGPDDLPFEPSAEELARDLGYTLGRSGERAFLAGSTPGTTARTRWAFALGQIEGHGVRIAAEREEHAYLASLTEERLAEHFHIDLTDQDQCGAVGYYS